MSASDVDIKKVLKIIGLGCLVACLAGAGFWASGLAGLEALRAGVGVGVGWVFGNLADVGMVAPNMEGLRK